MAHVVKECENPFSDYFGEVFMEKNGKLVQDFSAKLQGEAKHLLTELYQYLDDSANPADVSVYSGSAGLALLHFLLYDRLDGGSSDRFLRQAITFLEEPLQSLKKGETTFFGGDSGILAIAAAIYKNLGEDDKCEDCIKTLLGYYSEMAAGKGASDELVFGRVGYLFSMLYVQTQIGAENVDQEFVRILYRTVITVGQKTAKKHQWLNAALLWEWNEKIYLGAAHGVAGILYVLMQVSDPTLQNFLEDSIKPTVNTLLALRNYPSSASGKDVEHLVSWCNGSPGWTYMFVQASKVFNDKKYLKGAEACADMTWQKGFLQQGHSLCHGITGNAYSFLVLFRASGNAKYLYRACKFAEACCDRKKYAAEFAVKPLSLYEGITGTVYFMCDLLEPMKTRFPGFDL